MFQHKFLHLTYIVALSFSMIFLADCSKTLPLKIPGRNKINVINNNCNVEFTALVSALNSKNPENLRLIFTDDIVHYYGMPLFVGIDEVISMAKYFMAGTGESIGGKTFISIYECIGTWIFWGSNGFERSDPGIEYDLLQTREGKISFWRVFYGTRYLGRSNINLEGKDDTFLSNFSSSWSSNKVDDLIKIYAVDATLEDSLFGIEAHGQESIKQYANSFFAKSLNAYWELISPFAEKQGLPIDKYPLPSQGGVFVITVEDTLGNPCEIDAVIILTPNEDGKIQSEKVFYNANTLLACGWVK